jgi:hypothetical protein
MVSSKVAALMAYIGGTLLLLAGATGSVGIVGTIIEYMIENLGGVTANFLSMVLQVLNFVADLGGVAVIIGGSFVLTERKRTGRFIIGLGAGMGLIGFLLILASALLHGWANAIDFLFIISQSVGWIGVIFAIIATLLAK